MPTVPEQLEKLASLLEKGQITQEEYDGLKQALLAGSLGGPASGPGSSPSSDPAMRSAVGAYQLLSVIGEGGMGVVYRGRHRSRAIADRQGGDVAIKVMHPQYAHNPDYRDRFEREASMGLELGHPGIVAVHDLVVDGGELALVMELVEGTPLTDSVGEAVGPIPWERSWPLFQRLLDAVGYAHDQGVVHRDIKPDNILLTPDGAPHVIDFGIAKDVDASGTRTGTGMGTVEYMAPEQYADAKAVDRRADIYSLGMILYEMLAGRLPWDASATQFQILEQKARKQLRSPSAFCSDIPPEIVAALSPALSADPGERIASAPDFGIALQRGAAAAAERVEVERGEREEAERRAREEAERKAKEDAEYEAREKAELTDHDGTEGAPAGDSSLRSHPQVARGARDSLRDSPPERSPLRAVTLGLAILVLGCMLLLTFNWSWGDDVVWITIEERRVQGRFLPSFQISKTEVTVGQWSRCVADGQCDWPEQDDSECNFRSSGAGRGRGRTGRSAHPMNCVNQDEAAVFAGWKGARLPTGREWEFAATSRYSRELYPWSGEGSPSCTYAVMDDGGPGCGKNGTWEVCQKKAGNTEQGLCDMVGNVREWTGYRGLHRGGGWKTEDPVLLRATSQNVNSPDLRRSDFGFRVARDVSPP